MPLILPGNRPRSRFVLEHFDPHKKIGIDFDGTLVGHEHSAQLQQYICDHPEIEFHIVTFRSHGMQDKIDRDLWSSSKDTGIEITLKEFTGIHNISDGLYESHVALKGDPNYWSWKARKCAEIGCTIMIDDMAEQLYEDFDRLGVLLVSPDDFNYGEPDVPNS
jgi:hypothetical protein